MSKFDCNICANTCVVSKKVQCPYCEEIACRNCYESYTLTITNDPQCMFCNKTWSNEYVDENYTKVFVNKRLKTHRESVLLDREKAMLPQTQPYVTREKERRRMDAEIDEWRKIQQEIWKEYLKYSRKIQENQNNIARLVNTNLPVEECRKEFVRKCPKETCKGFLSTKWKCGLCESKVCKDCNEIITDEEHICNEDSKATIALIAKDTKPCPSCGTMIFKISGCSQMWCPDCHTAFDWRSGRIETGIVHNPHYFEFLRNNNKMERNPFDIVCGGLPTRNEFRILANIDIEETKQILNVHRLMLHIEHVELGRYNTPDLNFETNRELRVQYMMNDFTDEDFARLLQRKEKKRKMHKEYFQIFQMLHNTGCEYMRQLNNEKLSQYCTNNEVNDPIFNERIKEYSNIFARLEKYVNDEFEKVGKRYKCKYPKVGKNYVSIE